MTYQIFQALCVLLPIISSDAVERPNIFIVVGDDIGPNDFSHRGSNQIPTPNIDAIGFNGVILDSFYTQQTCTPSRAALLTGNYPIRSGLQGIPIDAGENRYIPLDMPTLPERLKELGYSTHMVGKWHLGAACEKVTPTGRGFDTHFGYRNGYVSYFDYDISVASPSTNSILKGFDLFDKFTPQWEHKGEYATELFTKKALEVIDNHNDEKPLLLIVNHLAAHAGKDGVELGVPNKTKTNSDYAYIPNPERRKFADIVHLMDYSIGQLVEKISDKGMLEKSIIIFLSDNGPQTIGVYQNHASPWPLRGLKFTLFEGGVRGTCVIYSPLLEKRGYINSDLMHISDLFKTLYHAAGGNVTKLGNIDGVNQWDVISKNASSTRNEILLNIDEKEKYSGMLGYGGQYKLLNGTFKYGVYDQSYGDSGRGPENPPYDIQRVLNSPTNVAIQKIANQPPLEQSNIENIRKKLDRGPLCGSASLIPKVPCLGFCLFDLKADPCETTNLILDPSKQDIVKNLKEKLSKYYDELVPQTNKPVDPRSDPANFNNTWSPWLTDCIAL